MRAGESDAHVRMCVLSTYVRTPTVMIHHLKERVTASLGRVCTYVGMLQIQFRDSPLHSHAQHTHAQHTCTTHMYNTHVQHTCTTHMHYTHTQHTYTTYIHNTHAQHTYTTYIHNTHAQHTCTTHMHNTHAQHTYTIHTHKLTLTARSVSPHSWDSRLAR